VPAMTFRIECRCNICETNAEKAGASFPLAAEVPMALSQVALTSEGRHGLVHLAHDPNRITGASARLRTGVRPAQDEPGHEPLGVFRATVTRDGVALERDGQTYHRANLVGDDAKDGGLFEVMFADGFWMLATAGDMTPLELG